MAKMLSMCLLDDPCSKRNIVFYYENQKVYFLYLDSSTKAVVYDLDDGSHRKIPNSQSQKIFVDHVLFVRLGITSILLQYY